MTTPITDPRAIKFCNEQVRVFADLLAQMQATARALVTNWNALGMSTLIPNTSAIVADSAAPNGTDATGGDGRPVITGAQATNIITRAQGALNWVGGSTDPGAGDGSNGVLNTILGVAVNTGAKF